MARIVALDCTAEFGSVALLENGNLPEELVLHSPEGFGGILFPQLKLLMDRHGWAIGEIDCFAAASGPGSFTGVRIGLTAAKGLAEATGRRVVAISNLEALAHFGTTPLRATVLDARRGEVYGAVYNSEFELVSAETVTKFTAWLNTLPEGELEFISPNFAPFRDALSGTRFETTSIREPPRALAGTIGRAAWRRYKAGLTHDPSDIDANYVRRSDAELLWKET